MHGFRDRCISARVAIGLGDWVPFGVAKPKGFAMEYRRKPCRNCGGNERAGSERRCVPCYRKRYLATKDADLIRYPRSRRACRNPIHEKFNIQGRFYSLCEDQDWKCLICGEIPKRLFVDHCHKTDKFRGLICPGCNSGLGFFKDNPKSLLNAAKYIQERS